MGETRHFLKRRSCLQCFFLFRRHDSDIFPKTILEKGKIVPAGAAKYSVAFFSDHEREQIFRRFHLIGLTIITNEGKRSVTVIVVGLFYSIHYFHA